MSMYSLTSRLLTVLALLASPLFSQLGPMPDLVADSLLVPVTADSTIDRSGLTVVDNRAVTDRVVGVRQIKKWRYIPVDQYFVLDKPLTTYLRSGSPADTTLTLVVEHLELWHDGRTWFSKGWLLNGSTRLRNSTGDVVAD